MIRYLKVPLFLLIGSGLFLLLQACGAPLLDAAEPMPEEPVTEAPSEEEPLPPMATALPSPLPTATLSLLLPTPTAVVENPITGEGEVVTPIPAIPEQRRLTLEWPPRIRAGDSDTIRLTLEIDDAGNIVPTAEIEGHAVSGEVVSIPNLYETHQVIAEARFDLAGVQVIPADMVSEPLLPGESVTFYWSVSPAESGEYRGTIWFYLRYIPKEGGEEMLKTISAQFVEIRATTFLGVKKGPARVMGAIGSFIGAVLGFPFVDDFLKLLWKYLKK